MSKDFCDRRLGKGVVAAKDTPNFIANRIGTFSVLNVMRLMQEMDLTIEEVDALTGTPVGWPKSATFRTIDLVGLDILAHVVGNMAGVGRTLMSAKPDERAVAWKPDYLLYSASSETWMKTWKIGQWNTLRIRMAGQKVSVWLNDKQTVDSQVMDNFFDPVTPHVKPLLAKGPIELQTHGSKIRFRNIYIREIPAAEAGAAR